MDGFHRMPVLQVRDPRALSDPSDIKALKNFFDSSPPLDADPISCDASPTSLAKSPDLRKQSRKRFFSLGKKRLSSSDLEVEPSMYGVNKSSSRSIPTGTTQRNLLGGHTVLMIGSPVPPMKMPVRTPTLEITPSSPIMAPHSPIHTTQTRLVSFSDPVTPRLSPIQPVPPSNIHGVRPLLLRQKLEIPEKKPPQSNFTVSLSESNHHPCVRQSIQIQSQPNSVPEVPAPHNLLESEASLKLTLPVPLIPLKMSTRGLGMTDADPGEPTLSRAKRSVSLTSWESQGDKVTEQALSHVRVTKTELAQSNPVECVPQSPQQKAANRRAIYTYHSDLSSLGTSDIVPPGLGLPLTPPPSLTSIPVLPAQISTSSLRSAGSAGSSKKRSRKNHVTPAPHSTPMPNLDYVPLEIVDLEAMEDKPEAFLRLAGMYKHQKFLREAEEDFHRQTIADLTAGLMAQKMENLKLVHLLQQKGVSITEVQSIGVVAPDATPLARDANADTLESEEGPGLDASRFAMLKKEEQLGLMRQFSSSQGSISTLEADASRRSRPSNDTNSAFDLIQRVKASGSRAILTPAPSMPLPPVPNTRRDIHSMIISHSMPVFAPIARSRSLTEGDISSVPYLDSFIIEHNMRRLERECSNSIRRRESGSTESVTSIPEFLEILFGYNELDGNDRNSGAQTLSAGEFSVVVEDVVDGVIVDTTMDSVPTTESVSNSGLCISSGLTFSVSTFQTAESSNDADVSTFSSTNGSPDPNPETSGLNEGEDIALLSRSQSISPFNDMRVCHTFYTNAPSVETSTANPSPRPASVDDGTWGALFMGLMRRADSRARTSSDGDLERGESISIKSAEV